MDDGARYAEVGLRGGELLGSCLGVTGTIGDAGVVGLGCEFEVEGEIGLVVTIGNLDPAAASVGLAASARLSRSSSTGSWNAVHHRPRGSPSRGFALAQPLISSPAVAAEASLNTGGAAVCGA